MDEGHNLNGIWSENIRTSLGVANIEQKIKIKKNKKRLRLTSYMKIWGIGELVRQIESSSLRKLKEGGKTEEARSGKGFEGFRITNFHDRKSKWINPLDHHWNQYIGSCRPLQFFGFKLWHRCCCWINSRIKSHENQPLYST